MGIDDGEGPREDAMLRARAQGLTGGAVELKAELEMAFTKLPEGQDPTVILLSTVIAERVVLCTDRQAASEVAIRAIQERGKLRETIRSNADALKAAVDEVIARFFRN